MSKTRASTATRTGEARFVGQGVYVAACMAMVFWAGCGDGQRVVTSHWPDGGPKEIRSVVPDANGQWLNHGPYTTYYMDGKTKAEEGAYEFGRLHGKITHWHENGQKKDEVVWEQGRVVGKPTFWDEQGKLIQPPAE